MSRSGPWGWALRRILPALAMTAGGLCVAQHARATTYLIQFSGIIDSNFYFQGYDDPYIYYPTGPFTTTLTLTYPLVPYKQIDPDYIPPEPGESYRTDATLGAQHVFFFPDYFGGYSSEAFVLGYRSISYGSGDGEGSSFDIGVESPTALFSTIAQPTPIDVDVSGTYLNHYGYYKEAQYGEMKGRVTHLTISILDAVPEPASWTLMIVGLGAIASSMRRRTGFATI